MNQNTSCNNISITFTPPADAPADWIILQVKTPERMEKAFSAESQMRFFKELFLSQHDFVCNKINAPSFDAYSFQSYDMSRMLVEPLHVEACSIARMITDEEGLHRLEEIGLNVDGVVPPYNPARPDSLLFWDELKQVVFMLEVMINQRVREEEQLLEALCSLVTVRAREQDAEENCGICLERFVEGECLTDLPCRHLFHLHCAASWLIVTPICPMDRRRVFETGEPASISR